MIAPARICSDLYWRSAAIRAAFFNGDVTADEARRALRVLVGLFRGVRERYSEELEVL